MLATVQGQRGWTNMTKVELVRARAIVLCAGHCDGTLSSGPGIFEYLVIQSAPTETAHNQIGNTAKATPRPRGPILLSSLNSGIMDSKWLSAGH